MPCILCDLPFGRFAGIQTSHGFVCYECVKWVHVIADETAALRDRPERDVLADIDATP